MEGPANTSRFRDLRLFVLLGVAATALLFLYLDERGALEDYRARAADFEAKHLGAQDVVRRNIDVLMPPKEKILNPTILAEKSLRTVVMESAEKTGLERNLESIDPTDDRKAGLCRARLSLANVAVRQIVAFIVELKAVSAGIRDVEATMRMQGYNVDAWRLDLTLEAPSAGAMKPNGQAAK